VTKIRIPPVLREATKGAREVEASGESVRELLDDLADQFPELRDRILRDDELAPFVNVYLEGEDVRTKDGLETQVRDGATLILLPAMAGGS
jgi:sulfur-carrier protein